jgi:hypothetical protein
MKKLMILVAAASALFVGVLPAHAGSAVISTYTLEDTFKEKNITDDCLPGAKGSLEATSVITEQKVETSTGFRLTGLAVDSGRIDWTNGDYTIVGSTDRYTVDYSVPAQGTFQNTDAHQDYGDFYTADGTLLFRQVFWSAEHTTITNGDVTRYDYKIDTSHIFGDGCAS